MAAAGWEITVLHGPPAAPERAFKPLLNYLDWCALASFPRTQNMLMENDLFRRKRGRSVTSTVLLASEAFFPVYIMYQMD
jgi:hypothetical protein